MPEDQRDFGLLPGRRTPFRPVPEPHGKAERGEPVEDLVEQGQGSRHRRISRRRRNFSRLCHGHNLLESGSRITPQRREWASGASKGGRRSRERDCSSQGVLTPRDDDLHTRYLDPEGPAHPPGISSPHRRRSTHLRRRRPTRSPGPARSSSVGPGRPPPHARPLSEQQHPLHGMEVTGYQASEIHTAAHRTTILVGTTPDHLV